MRKKICAMLIIASCTLAYSDTLKSNNVNERNSIYITEKGKSYMRQPLSKDEYIGKSGSTQNIEYVNSLGEFDENNGYNGYSTRTQGIVTGTTSRFKVKENSMWLTGVSFGYLHSDVDYDGEKGKEDVDTIGVNAYLGYNINNYLILGYLGGAIGDSDDTGDNNNVKIGVETGKFIFMGEKNTLYPYISLEGIRNFNDDYSYEGTNYQNNIENYYLFNGGLDYSLKLEKFQLKLFARYTDVLNDNEDIDIRKEGKISEVSSIESYEDGVNFGGSIYYYIDKDLYTALDVIKSLEENTDELRVGLRLGHIF